MIKLILAMRCSENLIRSQLLDSSAKMRQGLNCSSVLGDQAAMELLELMFPEEARNLRAGGQKKSA